MPATSPGRLNATKANTEDHAGNEGPTAVARTAEVDTHGRGPGRPGDQCDRDQRHADPGHAIAEGRSPNARPARTGTVPVNSAVTGATTLIGPSPIAR